MCVFIQYNLVIMDYTADFYSRPSSRGSGFPIFSASRRQRGGSVLGSLKKVFVPIAKTVGKKLLSSGIGLATAVKSDVLAGKNFTQSIKSRGKAQAVNFGKDALRTVLGNTLGRRPSRKCASSRKSAKRKPLSKKRRSTAKISNF